MPPALCYSPYALADQAWIVRQGLIQHLTGTMCAAASKRARKAALSSLSSSSEEEDDDDFEMADAEAAEPDAAAAPQPKHVHVPQTRQAKAARAGTRQMSIAGSLARCAAPALVARLRTCSRHSISWTRLWASRVCACSEAGACQGQHPIEPISQVPSACLVTALLQLLLRCAGVPNHVCVQTLTSS